MVIHPRPPPAYMRATVLLRPMIARWVITLAPAVLLLGACTDNPLSPKNPGGSHKAISDGMRQGNEHFFFLPPLVPPPVYSGVSDANAAPFVIICEWIADGNGGQCGEIVAHFARAVDADDEGEEDADIPTGLRYNRTKERFHVKWDTEMCISGPCQLDPAKTYRIRVFVGSALLGYADVDVVADKKELKNVATNEFIGLVEGKKLPIKFRVEVGAAVVAAPGVPVEIGNAGGNVASDDGNVSLAFPEGALAGNTPITISAPTIPLPESGAWSAPVELGPDGTTFSEPVTLTLGYDVTLLPEGVGPEALRLSQWVDDHWEEVEGSTLNEGDATISAPINHFSQYALVIWPNAVLPGVNPAQMIIGHVNTFTGDLYYWQSQFAQHCYVVRTFHRRSFGRSYYSYSTHCIVYQTGYRYPVPGMRISWVSVPDTIVAIEGSPFSYTDQNGFTTSPPMRARAFGTATVKASADQLGVFTSRSIDVTTPPVINPFPQGGTQLVLPVLPGSSAFAEAPISNLGGYPLTGLQVPGTIANCHTGEQYAWVTTSFVPTTSVPTSLRVTASPPAGTALGVYDVCFTLRGNFAQDRPYGTRISVQQVVVPNPPIINPFPQGGTQNHIAVNAGASTQKDVPISNAGGGTLSGLTVVGPMRHCNTGALMPWLTAVFRETTAPTLLTFTAAPPASVPPGAYDICFEMQARAVGAMDRAYGARVTVGAAQPIVLSVFATGTAPFRKFGFQQGTGMNVSIPGPNPLGTTVTLTHTNPAVAGSNPSLFIAPNTTVHGVGIGAGTTPGLDTLVVSAPGFVPDTLIIEADTGRISISGMPTTLNQGDSAAIRIHPTNEDGIIDNAWSTTFALSSNGKLSFSRNSLPITSIAVPDGSSATPVFYVKASGGGAATMSVTNVWYNTSPYDITVVPTIIDQSFILASMGDPRQAATASASGGLLYAMGGYSDMTAAITGRNEVYDPATNQWAFRAPMPTPRWRSASAVVNGIVYVMGGAPVISCCAAVTTVEAYDPATDSWSTKAPMPLAREQFAAVAHNGLIYVFGGWAPGFSATVSAYDPSTNSWTAKAPMPAPRGGHAVAVANGKFYVVGGENTSLFQTSVFEYDPATNTWATKAAMPTARAHLGAASVDGIVYALGGDNGAGRTIEAYDPATNSWSTKSQLNISRFAFGVAELGGVIYAVGGVNQTSSVPQLEGYRR